MWEELLNHKANDLFVGEGLYRPVTVERIQTVFPGLDRLVKRVLRDKYFSSSDVDRFHEAILCLLAPSLYSRLQQELGSFALDAVRWNVSSWFYLSDRVDMHYVATFCEDFRRLMLTANRACF